MVDNEHCRVCMLPSVEKQFRIRVVRDGGFVVPGPFDKDSTEVFVH